MAVPRGIESLRSSLLFPFIAVYCGLCPYTDFYFFTLPAMRLRCLASQEALLGYKSSRL